ncbi:hypothetical protein PIB30_080588, partial [Stylosanthes scabra]|nr:hypothetical protein [Stylosanthes scabra]
MLGSSSHVSGSSSRSRSHGSLARTSNRARSGKIPHWCGCGMRPVLRWSGQSQTQTGLSLVALTIIYRQLGRGGVTSLCGQIVKKKN